MATRTTGCFVSRVPTRPMHCRVVIEADDVLGSKSHLITAAQTIVLACLVMNWGVGNRLIGSGTTPVKGIYQVPTACNLASVRSARI